VSSWYSFDTAAVVRKVQRFYSCSAATKQAPVCLPKKKSMIVNYKQDGWEVLTQRAHGALAAQLAFYWRRKDRPQRWMETLLAVAEHDDAENELGGENLLTETGGPLSYEMKTFDLEHCRELSALTLTKSRYIALLVSMHMQFLYGKEAASNPEAKEFLSTQKNLQATWRKELNLSKEESLRIYSLLEWCDAVSLLICKGDIQPEKRRVEISTGPDEKAYFLWQPSEGTLSIDPWPFDESSFTVSFESRTISQLRFQSSEEFRQAFLAADVKENLWQLTKQKGGRQNRKRIL
jgi:hypothetical protein